MSASTTSHSAPHAVAMAGSSADVASEHIAEDGERDLKCVMMHVISFNFGMPQDMLNDAPWHRKHAQKFETLVEVFAEEYNADVVVGCEVGGHKQGLSEKHQASLNLPTLKVSFTQNYMTALNLLCSDAQQPITELKTMDPVLSELAGTQALETQLVMTAVQALQDTKKAAFVIIGNMHIRTPQGSRSPTIATRHRLVREALNKLAKYGEVLEERVPASERHGVVILLLGDCNLNEASAQQAVAPLQPQRVNGENASAIWQVKRTRNGLTGDLCFVRGCVASTFDVQVGGSYKERGMRNDSHDALGLILRLPLRSEDPGEVSSPTSIVNVPALSEEEVEKITKWMEGAEDRCNTGSLTSNFVEDIEPLLVSLERTCDTHELVLDARQALQRYRDMLASGGGTSESTEGAGNTGEAQKARSYELYDSIVEYFNNRADQDDIAAADAQLEKLAKLLFAKRKIPFLSDQMVDTQLAAKVIEARRTYADMHDVAMGTVTKRTLEESKEGLTNWLKLGEGLVGDDASELVVSRVSKQECATRIHGVLRDREKWLTAEGLPVDHQMTYPERGRFLDWILKEFQKTPIEADLIAKAHHARMTTSKIKKASRSRFNLEKQRRAGSSQVWELLSFTGKCTPEFLTLALEKEPQPDSAPERVGEDPGTAFAKQVRKDKDNLRYGKMLQNRLQKQPALAKTLKPWERLILQEAKDGTLKRKVNSAVLTIGRGRLRGDNDKDYLDIGTNRDRGVVNRILDGKRPKLETSRFER